MRRETLLIAFLLAWSSHAVAATTLQVGVQSDNLQFGFLYSDYGVAPAVVERDVPLLGESDFLVAVNLQQLTGVTLDVIVSWRRSGLTWDAVTRRCRSDARIYYVELPDDVTGPPYGRAHGCWRKHGKCDVALTDAEIRELVLVRGLARHTGKPAGDIVRMRSRGQSPKSIAAAHRSSHEDTAPALDKTPGGGRGAGHKPGKGGGRK